MNTSDQLKSDGSRFHTKEPLTEEAISQQRKNDDSTPKSTHSSESDGDINNEIASQGFERFRESSVGSILDEDISNDSCAFSPLPGDSIAEYCKESLYSYSFTPLSRVNKAAKIKRQILNRGMDHMQRIRWKTGERDTGRRFSQPDIGVLDQNNDWVTTEQLKAFPSMIDMSAVDNSYSSPPPSEPPPSLPHYFTTGNIVSMLPITPKPSHNLEEPIDDDQFNPARRKTIEVFNNLAPIYEKPSSTKKVAISPQYTRALHVPSRFLPQNQAVLTTDANGTILLFNDMTSLCFGINKSYIGKSILSAIEEPFQSQITRILERRRSLTSIVCNLPSALTRENRLEKGLVLVCGIVVPIRKMNGETSAAASLWLKEKKTDEGKNIYIWIFEEIYETSLVAGLDKEGIVTEIAGTTKELFGYEPDQIIGNPITLLIPALANGNAVKPSVNLEQIEHLKFYGGRSKSGIFFPTMVHLTSSHLKLKIVSLPSIAGLITIHSTGKIQSINPVPAKYLFGYSTEALVEKFDIDQIIPQFSDVVTGLHRYNLLQYSSTVNNHACRWAISDMCKAENIKSDEPGQSLKHLECASSISVNGQALPSIQAVHRDSSHFEIQLQLRLIESEEENLISIWVTYDRIHALKRSKMVSGAATTAHSQHRHKKSALPVPTILVTSTDQELSHPLSPKKSHLTLESVPTANEEHVAISKKRPPIRPYGISLFGSVDQSRALFPASFLEKHGQESEENEQEKIEHASSTEQVNSLNVLEKKKKHPMDDYTVIGNLGEGAYGTVKLAFHKDDINKTKVVIKFIAKSRIIIDSWIRDRQSGLMPLEIHVLRKLKQNPHVNCCCLLDYMEDEDTYFVVMQLHGETSMDLFDYIELNEHITEPQVRNIFKQVALAVKHIQDLSIVHRDIKDENVLLDETGCVHLIDFGSAAYFRKGRTFDTFGGTLDYASPETLKGMPYEGPPQDIWALGILLFTLIYRENPFYNIDEIMSGELRIPFVLSEGSLDLIRKMLNRDVEKRCTIDQVLEHPWLKEPTQSVKAFMQQ